MKLYKGVLLIILSALCVTAGQLLWKLSADHFYLVFVGFALYALGALLMIMAFRFGELSVLHPMLSVSYVLAILIGYFFLSEPVTLTKVGGVAAIFIGMLFLGLSGKEGRHE
jgi:undecaprenyl phosphate-alpha-L-ara4N flippase subunit ArnE